MAEQKNSDWLTRKRAADFLAEQGCPVAPRTLEKWATDNNSGGGPSFTRIRTNIVRYNRKDLLHWAQKNMVRVL